VNTENKNADRPLSRQRFWQIKAQAEGKCVVCGKPRKRYKTYCDDCAVKCNARDAKYRRAKAGVTAPMRVFHCSVCGTAGHNSASCPVPLEDLLTKLIEETKEN